MKKLSIVIIAVLAVAAIALGGLYFKTNADKTAQIDSLNADVAAKVAEIDTLTADAAEKDAAIEALNTAAAEKDAAIEALNTAAAEKDAAIEALNTAAAEKDAAIDTLNADVAAKAAEIDMLTAAAAEKDTTIDMLTADAAAQAAQIEALNESVTAKDTAIADLEAKLDYAAMDEDELLGVVAEITPPLEALGYEVNVGVPVPVDEPVPAEEPAAEAPAAQENADVLTFTHPRFGFSFDYPADMVLMSQDNIDQLIDEMLSGELVVEGMDVSMLQQQADIIKQQDMTMLAGKGGLFNVNIGYSDVGMQLTDDQFIDFYCPILLEQYKAMYPECDVLDEGSLYTIGDNNFSTQTISVNAAGTTMTVVVLYGLDGTNLCNMAFTVADMLLDVDSDYANNALEIIASTLKYAE